MTATATFARNAHSLAAANMIAIGELHRSRRAEEFHAIYDHTHTVPAHPYALTDGHGVTDYFRSMSGAEHAARLLNSGACHVEPHRTIGARIIPNEQR